MGYYIQGPAKGKAQYLVDEYNAEIVSQEKAEEYLQHEEYGVICVVNNGPFEAAAFCYSDREFVEFSFPDGRPRTWLVMDRPTAERASGYTG